MITDRRVVICTSFYLTPTFLQRISYHIPMCMWYNFMLVKGGCAGEKASKPGTTVSDKQKPGKTKRDPSFTKTKWFLCLNLTRA